MTPNFSDARWKMMAQKMMTVERCKCAHFIRQICMETLKLTYVIASFPFQVYTEKY